MAAAIGCSPSVLSRLLLTVNPCADDTDPEAPAWQTAAQRLARVWDVDSGRLESVLRAALHFRAGWLLDRGLPAR